MKKWGCVIIGIILGFIAEWLISGNQRNQSSPSVGDEPGVNTIISTDTLSRTAVAAKDSEVVSYATIKLPRARNESRSTYLSKRSVPKDERNISPVSVHSDSIPDSGSGLPTEDIKADSTEIMIPIKQYTFEDSTFRAVVRGWGVKLDTMEVYARREVVTVKKPPNRWVIGPSIGVAVTGRGIMPYIGIGVTYNLLK
jgi:hypothetical protein